MKIRDFIGALFFLLLALLSLEEARRLPVGTWKSPAPGFFPLVLSFLLLVLAAFLLWSALAKPGKEASRVPFFASSAGKKRVWLTVSALLFFNLSLETLGFLLTSFIFLALLIRVLSSQKWVVVLGGSFLFSFSLYVLFDLLFKLPLPRSGLGF